MQLAVSGEWPLLSIRADTVFYWSPATSRGGSQARFYKRLIAMADKRFDAHLERLKGASLRRG